MCDPASIALATAAAGATQGALSVRGQQKANDQQQQSIQTQSHNAQNEANFETLQQQQANIEEGYVTALNGRQSIAQARVRGSTLGIRGTTAAELIADQQRVAAHNDETTIDRAQNITGASQLGNAVTASNAGRQVNALKASRPGLPELLLATASGGLQGYVTGTNFTKSAGIK